MIPSCRACDPCGVAFGHASDGPCPWCGEALSPMEPPLPGYLPEAVVEPVVDVVDARRRLQAFVSGVSFPSGGLVSDNTAARLALVFLPSWRLRVDACGVFRVEAGFETEVKGLVETYSLGRWSAREVVEPGLHWEPRVGRVRRTYDEVEVPGHEAHTAITHLVGTAWPAPVEVDRVVAPVLLPDRAPPEPWPLAFEELRRRVGEDVRLASAAAEVRAVELELDPEQARWTWALLPVWVTWYRDEDGRLHRLWVHGTSGVVGGPRMASPSTAAAHARTASLLAMGLGTTGLLVGGLGLLLWVLLPIAAVCLIGALVAGARSLTLPHAIASWNRRELARSTPGRDEEEDG